MDHAMASLQAAPDGNPNAASEASPASTATTDSQRARKRSAATDGHDSIARGDAAANGADAAAAGAAVTVSSSTTQEEESGNRRKQRKVSRACDYCKTKKLRCSGTIPCSICTRKKLQCLYDAQYRRGRPPMPPSAKPGHQPEGKEKYTRSTRDYDKNVAGLKEALGATSTRNLESSDPQQAEGVASRASPELETAEIEGQFFDPTSNLTFLHRAWKRFSLQQGRSIPNVLTGSERSQPLMSAGDTPFAVPQPNAHLVLPDRNTATRLLEYYFERCVVTYRFLHQPSCFIWLDAVASNRENSLPLQSGIGHAKAALVMTILAIATLRQEKVSGNFSPESAEGYSLRQGDHYFCVASNLTSEETGLPTLESVQSRLLQALYLLQSARMNQAWYTFGSTVPIVSALGLHRRSGRNRSGPSPTMDYIATQCRKRTFWVVYTIDKYLAVVFGRPRLCHDDDVDQDYPERVNDEDMTPQGPRLGEPSMDPHVDSLIFHAKVARIIDNISREVYSLKKLPKTGRLSAARHFTREVHQWREALPPHLGTVRLRSLVPTFRRQATALKLAYCHAIMHANRPFLLGHGGQPSTEALKESVAECLGSARTALETVDAMVSDGSVFHALWWTPYVTFCALAVVYVWEIQQKAHAGAEPDDAGLFELAERCQGHLAEATASDSPSRRYSIILEELRLEARQSPLRPPAQSADGESQSQLAGVMDGNPVGAAQDAAAAMPMELGHMFPGATAGEGGLMGMANVLDEWQATDWLDLDSSAFGPFPPDFEGSLWMPDVG